VIRGPTGQPPERTSKAVRKSKSGIYPPLPALQQVGFTTPRLLTINLRFQLGDSVETVYCNPTARVSSLNNVNSHVTNVGVFKLHPRRKLKATRDTLQQARGFNKVNFDRTTNPF
jgi:hypothetical protein